MMEAKVKELKIFEHVILLALKEEWPISQEMQANSRSWKSKESSFSLELLEGISPTDNLTLGQSEFNFGFLTSCSVR
jgi:hypothetical protein